MPLIVNKPSAGLLSGEIEVMCGDSSPNTAISSVGIYVPTLRCSSTEITFSIIKSLVPK